MQLTHVIGFRLVGLTRRCREHLLQLGGEDDVSWVAPKIRLVRPDKLRESGEWDVGTGRQNAKGVVTIALAFFSWGNRCDRCRLAPRDEVGRAISQRVGIATDQIGEFFAGQIGVVRPDAIGVRLHALFR
ncbi:hypothetical protein A9762_07110 [Pandoraea sp. ISTKB]|nr:hypothetical protein A9762_07110 [Pandoraea sp. ISTKB]